MPKNKQKNLSNLKTSELLDKVIGIQKRTLDLQKDTAYIQKEYATFFTAILDALKDLQRVVFAVSFFVNILYLRVFLWDPLEKILEIIFNRWKESSEAWKIFYLSVPTLFISAIIAQLASHYAVKKIEQRIPKKYI